MAKNQNAANKIFIALNVHMQQSHTSVCTAIKHALLVVNNNNSNKDREKNNGQCFIGDDKQTAYEVAIIASPLNKKIFASNSLLDPAILGRNLCENTWERIGTPQSPTNDAYVNILLCRTFRFNQCPPPNHPDRHHDRGSMHRTYYPQYTQQGSPMFPHIFPRNCCMPHY
jgi:hypothetical protein